MFNKNDSRSPGRFSWAHEAFAVLGIILFSKAFFFLFVTDLQKGPDASMDHAAGTPVTSNHPELVLIFLAVYSLSGILILFRLPALLQMRMRLAAVALLVLLAFLSAGWSLTPASTLARGVALSGTAVFGVYLALRFNAGKQLELLCRALLIVAVGSFLNVVWFPELAIMSGFNEGLWNGVFTHKNKLGAMAGFSVLLFLIKAASRAGRDAVSWIGLVLSFSLLILSYSKTALIASSLCLALIGLVFFFSGRRGFGVLAAASSLTLTLALLVQLAFSTTASIALSELADREMPAPAVSERASLEPVAGDPVARTYHSSDTENMFTGTGRLALWVRTLDFIVEKPLLGYGLGGFWIRDGGPFESAETELGWWPNHAHNGYLNLALELGCIGLGIYLALFLGLLLERGKQAVEHDFKPVSLFYPAVLVYIALFNLTETGLFGPNQLNWVLFIMIMFSSSALREGGVAEEGGAEEGSGR